MRLLTELLGDPQHAAPVVHVAGTNGKTSTARMIDSLLRAFGLQTGLTTSPHLQQTRERIVVGGDPISAERFVAVYRDVAPYATLVDQRSARAGGPPVSYFELVVAMAFAAFADAPVDAAVLEVGLGGTWDATNVADATVAVICPIGLDHTELLGDSVGAIAAEKAGIIKPDCLAVSGRQEPDALAVLESAATDAGTSLAVAGRDFGVRARRVAVGGQEVDLQGLAGTYEGLFLPLFGPYQADNAALALAAVESFLGGGSGELDPAAVYDGFAASSSPGRLEVVRRGPTVLLDAAHNPAGAQALVDAVRDSFDFTVLVGVVGILEGKDARGILTTLEPVLAEIVVTRPPSARGRDADELAAVAVEVFGADRVEVVPDLADALDAGIRLAEEAADGPGSGVLVTGSVVTVGAARAMLRREG
ncbi:MAG: bifunctional folylpolyglutamate synthase/dihydrofolate synthase [Actinomycetota bacterium]|nr:MAG: bifunctional folylpolyglutamate synthase/dihydrofolate synthase [Actinomycetota bacterium]